MSRVLYLDCGMGAAGDMLTAALLECFEEPEKEVQRLNALNIQSVVYEMEKSVKCGITGTHVRVLVKDQEESEEMHGHHDHHHMHLSDVCAILDQATLDEQVRKDAEAVYRIIAEAESRVHGRPVEEVHFHEVGALDAIADVCAVCTLIHDLKIEHICSSVIHTGFGQVKCAHGILPVPAPATATILCGMPFCEGRVEGELCTPTGAALLKYFCSSFGEMPVLRVSKIGYGMGKKNFERANCVRAFLGESGLNDLDSIVKLECNLDDQTPESIAFACQQLRNQNALEVYTTDVAMKKGRPGVLLTVLCKEEEQDSMLRLIFKHTHTLGIRINPCARAVLHRSIVEEETCIGTIRKKISDGYGVHREKYEYEDLAKKAIELDCSLQDILAKLKEE